MVDRKDHIKTPAGLQLVAGAAEVIARLNGGRSTRAFATRGARRHFFRTMIKQADEPDRTASAMREDVLRVAKGRPCHWVTVHDIAQRLGLDDDASDAAVRRAIDQGWFVADGDPPHSVRLSVVPTAT